MNRLSGRILGRQIAVSLERPLTIVSLLLLGLSVASSFLCAAVSRDHSSRQEGDFFIVSSVDVGKNQIVLKLPTEVTELMLVTESTVFLNEEGKPMRFQQLRAGDTVYVVAKTAADGTHVARRVRRGPMTVEELRRRYLSGIVPSRS